MPNSWQSPVAGEPSLGMPHEMTYANRSTTALVDTATNTAGVWSAAVTVTCPAGTRAVYCHALCYDAGGAGVGLICFEKASGVTLDDITVGNAFRKYRQIRNDSATVRVGSMIWIPLDTSYQFKWCSYSTNSRITVCAPVDYDC